MSAVPRDTRCEDAPLAAPPVSRPIRVALVANNPGGFTHPAQAEAVRQAGRHLAAAGYTVEEVAHPDPDEVIEVWRRVVPTDRLSVVAPSLEGAGDATQPSHPLRLVLDWPRHPSWTACRPRWRSVLDAALPAGDHVHHGRSGPAP